MGKSSRHSGLGATLWFIPVLCVLGGVILSIGTIAVDRSFDYELVPEWVTGGPDAVLSVFQTIATSMVSLAALVLTITMVVVQLAMGQFSPRIVQTFLRDRPSQLAIGLFVATFAHSMLAMREVRLDPDGQVPGVAVLVAYVLVLTSIAMLVTYVHHIGQSLRVSALIELVGRGTREAIDQRYPDELVPQRPRPEVITATKSAVITGIDRTTLVEVAETAGCTLHLSVPLGTFVPAGAELLQVEGDPSGLDRDRVLGAFDWGLERDLGEDVAYGFRMLVDVAERSLSESPFLDPTTATQALDRLHDGLRQIGTRELPSGEHCDGSGTVRLTVPTMGWDDYVHLALDEIRLAGAGSPQISRRMVAALEDLLGLVPADRRPVLEEQLSLLRGAVRDLERSERDRGRALVPDVQGLGAGPDGHTADLDLTDASAAR